jgi:hypothetical protein
MIRAHGYTKTAITEYTSLGVHDPWGVLTAATSVGTSGMKTDQDYTTGHGDVDCVEK